MGKETGFLEYRRQDPGYRAVDERIRDFRAVELRLPDGILVEQAARCMDCGIPFCHGCGCPLANVIPEWNDRLYRGRLADALALLLSTNPFPEFTGRICPAPCETSCVLGINDDPVAIRQIEVSVIEQAFERGLIVPRPPEVRRNKRVAVVGSGPAGLSAANTLNRMGFHTVVYEQAAKPGGILRYGIPDFKLEKWVIDRRVDLMKNEGIAVETGVEVGRDVSYRYLRDRFDAIVLTGGAREPRNVDAPGRDLKGIHFAMPFLVQQNQRCGGEPVSGGEDILATGKDVAVIGGGDTGADCVGTAIRQGAKSVVQLEIMPKPPDTRDPSTPWPAWPNMLRTSSSHKEGGERRWSCTVESFSGREGRVTGLTCHSVEWTADARGRTAPRKIAGSEFTAPAELVLLAMGFVGPGPNQLVDHLGLEKDSKGFLRRDADGMTSSRGVFVAGDMTRGASLVVRAMEDGRQTARAVAAFLEEGRRPQATPPIRQFT
jgi:glutamate synthase (NADPH/NADH) small chain